jgi:hypothetical protein
MRIENLLVRAIGVLIAFLVTYQISVSQSSATASLEVVIKDPSGAVINKAQVQLLLNGKQQSIAQTNQKGEARFNIRSRLADISYTSRQ